MIVPRARGYSGHEYIEQWVPLSGETYLRLGEVDLDDPNAILAFATTYGTLGGLDAYDTLMSRHDPFFKNLYQPQLDREREYEKKKRALWKEVTRANAEILKHEQIDEWGDLPGGLGLEVSNSTYIETLDEFRFAARCLRDLTSAWQMWRNGLEVTEFEWVSPSRPELFESDDEPTHLLARMLPRFLRPFSPQLLFTWSTRFEPQDLASGVNVEPLRGPAYAPLYAICALEIFNHIIENAEYRVCANERCQRTFVHQQGRSKKGQRRSRGVLYCSPACARATAQREYRRRRRSHERADERNPGVSNTRTSRPRTSNRP